MHSTVEPEHPSVTCPHCWQYFSLPGPSPDELPTSWDYDCEVCCRPMVIDFSQEGQEVVANARSLDDN